jgi:hypothetical protein
LLPYGHFEQVCSFAISQDQQAVFAAIAASSYCPENMKTNNLYQSSQ